MDMKLKVAEYIAQAAQQSFENCALTGNDVSAMIETPPDKKMGDYALPCFRLSKTMSCAPQRGQVLSGRSKPSATEPSV